MNTADINKRSVREIRLALQERILAVNKGMVLLQREGKQTLERNNHIELFIK